MPGKPNTQTTVAGLRRRAVGRLHNRRPAGSGSKSASDTLRVLHELEVHKLELEMQNSELRIARDALEVALEKYTDLYDFAPAGYFSVDESGAILEANLTSAVLLGVERSRLIHQRLPLLISPPDRPNFLAFLKKAFAGPRGCVCAAQLVKADGGAFWAEFRATSAVARAGTVTWCRVSFADITERKTAEEALRVSEERFRALFELGPVAVYSCDSAGLIQEFNRHAAKLWGREPRPGDTDERFCGSFKLFRPDGSLMPHERSPMAEVISGKRPTVRDAEVLIERPDGSQISVIVNIRPLKNHRGEITGAINCFYDITERKRAEAARQRIEVLAVSNQKLEREIIRRQLGEKCLKRSEQNQIRLLKQSHNMEEQLRRLSRQILSAQEEERKKISRELHDVIAQTLTSINVRLASLKKEALHSTRDLDHKIARTQRLVEHSVDIVHRFVRELRPTVLDDLGLIPALHTFMKTFREETGIRVSLAAFAAVEQVNGEKRTVLFRVAQEALTNIARHARASQVRVKLAPLNGAVCLKVIDNGKGFQARHLSNGKKNQRLGLLGMRERLEMVGGKFSVTSAPGKGTTVRAEIPLADARAARAGGGGGGRNSRLKTPGTKSRRRGNEYEK